MIKTVAIVANPKSAHIRQAMIDLLDTLKRYRVEILYEKRAAEVMGHGWHASDEEIRKKADFMVVLGGDGTVLSAARLLRDSEIPILGVHMGRLGFITEINPNELREMVTAVMEKRLPTHRRMRIECGVTKNDEVVYTEHALNDITINKGGLARMVEFGVYVGDARVDSYRADGFIVSTPTGSTGYALSAGGSVADPNMQLMLLCPICSHSMSTRALVISPTSVVKIKLTQPRQDIYVSQDGQMGRSLHMGETLAIKKADFDTVLYYKPGRNFYDHLRAKFGWGE